MTTIAKLTLNQQRVLGAVGEDWRSTQEVSRIAGIEARLVLLALYTRRFVDRRQIETGRLPLEWRLESVE
jgi:hypothetical protein